MIFAPVNGQLFKTNFEFHSKASPASARSLGVFMLFSVPQTPNGPQKGNDSGVFFS